MSTTKQVLAELRLQSSARAAFVVDDADEVVAFDGAYGITADTVDQLALASLAGGADGLLRVIGDSGADGVGVMFHEQPGQDVWIARLRDDRTLVVLFEKEKATPHAIRQQIKAVYERLVRAIDEDG